MNQTLSAKVDKNRFSALLAGTEWEHAELIPTVVDTGLRQYFRLSLPDKTAYLMDMSLSGLESGLEQYIKIDEYLASLGVRVPEIYFYDLESGYAVIEDLGSQSFGDAIKTGDDKRALYRRATEVLVKIKSQVKGNDLGLVEIQKSVPWLKLSFFPLDYIPAATKTPSNPNDLDEFNKIFNQIIADAASCPQTMALADYHLENIMKLDADKDSDYALIDFQDAMWVQQPYDLLNLLEDARTTVPEDIKTECKEIYCAGMSAEERQGFDDWYVILSMFFHCKVVGQFTKYYLERGLDAYIQHIPRLQSYIVKELEHPIMKPLKNWLDDKRVPFDIPLDELLKK
jgi:aminoglycoside/choline kinase family phosphotransferase